MVANPLLMDTVPVWYPSFDSNSSLVSSWAWSSGEVTTTGTRIVRAMQASCFMRPRTVMRGCQSPDHMQRKRRTPIGHLSPARLVGHEGDLIDGSKMT